MQVRGVVRVGRSGSFWLEVLDKVLESARGYYRYSPQRDASEKPIDAGSVHGPMLNLLGHIGSDNQLHAVQVRHILANV